MSEVPPRKSNRRSARPTPKPTGASNSARANFAAKKRRRNYTVAGTIVVVVAVVVALVIISVSSSNKGASETAFTPVPASVIANMESVTPIELAQAIKLGQIDQTPNSITGPALDEAGQPELLYIGGEFCPYCAATRWSIILALMQFGQVTNLGELRSATTDINGTEPYPNTATFTMANAKFTPDTGVPLTFRPVEIFNRDAKSFQTPTSPEESVYKTYGGNGIPFLYWSTAKTGVAYTAGSYYDPSVLAGLNQAQIASQLTGNSQMANDIKAAAANIATQICGITGDQPSSVCTTLSKGS